MASTRASISKASKRPKINIIPPKQLFVDLTQDDTKTPSPKHQLSSPSAPNAPSKTPSTKGTSSSSIDYTPKSPTSSTSPSTNGYLNSPTSPPPRVPPPPPTQENVSMDITLTLSPITPLDYLHGLMIKVGFLDSRGGGNDFSIAQAYQTYTVTPIPTEVTGGKGFAGKGVTGINLVLNTTATPTCKPLMVNDRTISPTSSCLNVSANKNGGGKHSNEHVNEFPSSCATKLSPTSLAKANLRKLDASVPKDDDCDVWLPLAWVHEGIKKGKAKQADAQLGEWIPPSVKMEQTMEEGRAYPHDKDGQRGKGLQKSLVLKR
ncbi:hypothetical protein Tco_0904518 [Tanacetum coccineum]